MKEDAIAKNLLLDRTCRNCHVSDFPPGCCVRRNERENHWEWYKEVEFDTCEKWTPKHSYIDHEGYDYE